MIFILLFRKEQKLSCDFNCISLFVHLAYFQLPYLDFFNESIIFILILSILCLFIVYLPFVINSKYLLIVI